MLRRQDGSAVVETVFAIVIVMFLTLGVVQVALSLYGRNVIVAAAHEGARAGIELGRNPAEAAAIARATVLSAAGSLVRGLTVSVTSDGSESRSVVRVRVSGMISSVGPLPIPVPIDARSSAVREGAIE